MPFLEDPFLLFMLNLAVTYTICSLPIMIYRYYIRKYSVQRGKAFWICVLYGIFSLFLCGVIAFFCGSSISGKGVIFWSFINYYVLVKEGTTT